MAIRFGLFTGRQYGMWKGAAAMSAMGGLVTDWVEVVGAPWTRLVLAWGKTEDWYRLAVIVVLNEGQVQRHADGQLGLVGYVNNLRPPPRTFGQFGDDENGHWP
jgi:hypothetical protein